MLRPRGSGVQRTLRPALVASLALALAGCEADHIAVRAVLEDLGLHGVALRGAPVLGRPCRWSEPFAVRFRAVREDGVIVTGVLCASDESGDGGRLLDDPSPGARR